MARVGTRSGSAGRAAARAQDPDLAAIERAMIQIRRRQTRRPIAKAAMQAMSQRVDLEHVAVVDAIEEGSEQPGSEVTVGDVAERLGIDPSRASRVVTAAIKAGYVRRLASQADGRRICLELTADGQRIVDN